VAMHDIKLYPIAGVNSVGSN